MGIISERLKKRILKMQKMMSISDLYEVAKQIEEDKKTVKSLDQLNYLHPTHAVYIETQNLVSYLAENLTVFPELDEYSNTVRKAQDEYLPQGPPMSSLTKSYFTSWAFFDVHNPIYFNFT